METAFVRKLTGWTLGLNLTLFGCRIGSEIGGTEE